VPLDHCLGFHEDEHVGPSRPHPSQRHPEKPIGRATGTENDYYSLTPFAIAPGGTVSEVADVGRRVYVVPQSRRRGSGGHVDSGFYLGSAIHALGQGAPDVGRLAATTPSAIRAHGITRSGTAAAGATYPW